MKEEKMKDVIEFWDKDGNKGNVPVKRLDEVTCDRGDCSVFGSFYKCYQNNQSDCGIYVNWMRECDKQNKGGVR